ncbi:MAG: alpha-D-ribose 1-methylphosphonate 5-triphosphate diphosphatase [Thalassobaculaceae bacterium]
MTETILTNANIVLAEEIVAGTVQIRDGRIADVATRSSTLPQAEDMGGDYLMPGLVELHTDNLEKHMAPRPKTDWPATAALLAHDGQLAAAGITTVFDALSLGALLEEGVRIRRLKDMIEAIANARAHDLTRAEHLLHLRCEISYPGLPEIVEEMIGNPMVKLVSVMDHTPGQRQFVREDTYRVYYQGKHGLSDAEMDAFIHDRKADQEIYSAKHRRYIVDRARELGLGLASHDDATPEHVQEAIQDGMTIAEFPTTVAAAQASHEGGLKVLMGGPNLVRGGSHSGNVSAIELARHGVLDIVSSDYVPNSLLHAAFLLFDDLDDWDLPRAVRAVTKSPAEAAGLYDRGEITAGRRADLLRVRHTPHHPLIKGVWREGQRIA